MRKSNVPPPDIDQLRKLGYEKSDVSLPILTKWIIFLFGFIAFSAAAGWVIYIVFVPGIGIEETPSALARGEKLPPSPALQANPKRDIVVFRQQEAERAEHYSWFDKDKDVVHIPLDRAMELVAERGFPSKADANRITVEVPPNIENEFRIGPEENGAAPPGGTTTPPEVAPETNRPPATNRPPNTEGGIVPPGGGGIQPDSMGGRRPSNRPPAGTTQPGSTSDSRSNSAPPVSSGGTQ